MYISSVTPRPPLPLWIGRDWAPECRTAAQLPGQGQAVGNQPRCRRQPAPAENTGQVLPASLARFGPDLLSPLPGLLDNVISNQCNSTSQRTS